MMEEQSLEFRVFHLFCGLGGGALGFQAAKGEWRGFKGQFNTLGGVDVDPEACQDFEQLTGIPATRLDLFRTEDYTAFHGHEPPAGWAEATPEDIRAAAQNEHPDVVFTSSPCKGLSALLPKAQAESRKYQALNNLTVRGIWLTVEAWKDNPPGLIIFENVPRITSRGKPLLDRIKALLHAYGYEVADGIHDVGEVGGLAQHRRRYLLVARHAAKIPSFLYHPPRRKVKAIGSVLGDLPMPDDPASGPLHKLPRLNWLTWLRLALIPAGGDWRDLQNIAPGSFGITAEAAQYDHTYRVTDWKATAGTVTGGSGPSNGAVSVADPRLPGDYYEHLYRVTGWEDTAGTVTAATRPAGGAASAADPRPTGQHWRGHFRIIRWGEPAKTVTGQSGSFSSKSGMAVADARLGHSPRKGVFQVNLWDQPANTVIGSASVRGSNGVAAVADPGLRHTPREGSYDVADWDGPSRTVTGAAGVGTSNGAQAVADPRGGPYGVLDWEQPAGTVTGNMRPSCGTTPASVADPCIRDRVGSGALCVADPHVPDRPTRRAGDLSVHGWGQAASTVTAEDSVGSGGQSVADIRLPDANGRYTNKYGIQEWDGPAHTVTGMTDVQEGAPCVGDPRPISPTEATSIHIPANNESGVWVIISEDGTWHRPLTTLELACLQGLPAIMRDGRPLTLVGNSQARFRERIGNAVPAPAARAVAESMLQTLIPSSVGALVLSTYGTAVWVRMMWRIAVSIPQMPVPRLIRGEA